MAFADQGPHFHPIHKRGLGAEKGQESEGNYLLDLTIVRM